MENPLWSYFQKKKDPLSLVPLLKSLPIFADLNHKECVLVTQILHLRHYEKGEWVFHQGEAGMGMYLISEGEVEILQEESEGKYLNLANLTSAQAFGEMALVDESPRSASARSLTQTTLFGFFKPDLISLIEHNPALGCKILQNLASILAVRLRRTNQLLAVDKVSESTDEAKSF